MKIAKGLLAGLMIAALLAGGISLLEKNDNVNEEGAVIASTGYSLYEGPNPKGD